MGQLRKNTGHGHVHERPDGMKARCGGPVICSICSREKAGKIAGEENSYENKFQLPEGSIRKRPGTKPMEIASGPNAGETEFKLIAMTKFGDDIIVCTEKGVYRVRDDQLVPIAGPADFKAADERYEKEHGD